MLKKMVLLGGAGAVLLGLFIGQSHVRTTVGMVRQQVKDSVPIKFEIKRARQMIKDLAPEIEKNMRLIAQEEVHVAQLEDRVADAADQLAIDEKHILRENEHLASGQAFFVAASQRYSRQEVQADLISRFEQFKTQKATQKALKEILAARQAGLQAAREKLNEMLAAQRQLEVEVENHVASLAMVDVQKSSKGFHFDDSQLARTRELVDEIKTRIQVQAKLANAELHRPTRIPLEAEPELDVDISDEITKYFADKDARFAVNQ